MSLTKRRGGVLPTVDVTINGTWSGRVRVTMRWPWGQDASPVVLHDSTVDGLTLYSGGAVEWTRLHGHPAVSVGLTDLSPLILGPGPKCPQSRSTAVQSLLCATVAGKPMFDAWRDFGYQRGVAAAARLSGDRPCGYAYKTQHSLGRLSVGVSCTGDYESATGKASWTLTNNVAGDFLAWKSFVVYSAHVGARAEVSSQIPAGLPELLMPLAKNMQRSDLLPGAPMTIRKDLNSGETPVTVDVDKTATVYWQTVQTLAGMLSAAVWKKLRLADAKDLYQEFHACRHRDVSCVVNAVTSAVGFIIKHPRKFSPEQVAMAKSAGKIFKYAVIAEFGASFVEGLALQQAGPWTVYLRNYEAVDPPDNRGGDSYIARDASDGRAVLVADGKVFHIPNADVFNCLARTRYVWDIGALAALDGAGDGVASCVNTGRERWTYSPGDTGGNVPDNVILRMRPTDSTGGPVGTWLVNNTGAIQSIPDGGTYQCLAATNPVIWNVPLAKIHAWTPVGSTLARCGPTPPTRGPLDPGLHRVSVAPNGEDTSGHSYQPKVSADGTVVAFLSNAPEYANSARGGETLVIRDLQSGKQTVLATNGNGYDLSADGSTVVYRKPMDNVVYGGAIVAYNWRTGATFLPREDLTFTTIPIAGYDAAISANGRYMAELVFNTPDGQYFSGGVVVRFDTTTGSWRIASRTDTGQVGAGNTDLNFWDGISDDGNEIRFISQDPRMPGPPGIASWQTLVRDIAAQRTYALPASSWAKGVLSHNGTYYAYGGPSQVSLVRIDDGSTITLSVPGAGYQPANFCAEGGVGVDAVSNDGARFLIRTCGKNGDVYLLFDRSNNTVNVIDKGQVADTYGGLSSASADLHHIVFARPDTGERPTATSPGDINGYEDIYLWNAQ